MIPYGRQSIDEDDILAVLEVMRGDWLTQGPKVDEFEHALIRTTGARFAVAFSHGTAALHAAAAAARLGAGDLIVTSPLSFVASANCARYVGADVGFVDIDPATLNMDVTRLPRCDALVAVHYAGLPVDLTRIAKRPRIVIEDASHALGATTPDGPVGNCANSDMCTFSFHPVKAITTGEGGAVTTNNPTLANSLRRFRNHGIERVPERGEWYYEVTEMGFNYRLTDLQAALGISQLSKLDSFIRHRQGLASRYESLLSALPIAPPPSAPLGWTHAYHLYTLRVSNRAAVFSWMRGHGIGVQVHYVPIHWHPLFREADYGLGSLPCTEAAYKELLSIPLFPSLTEKQQDEVVLTLAEALNSTI